MRQIDDAFRARLASGVTTTCLCWRLTRQDGQIVAVTEHDRVITFRGLTYNPGAAVQASEFSSSSELRPGQAGAAGALSSEAITDDDLIAGLWDSAEVDVFRVDWEMPEFGIQIWSGRFSEITRSDIGFQAELVSLKADLERPVGRVYSRQGLSEDGLSDGQSFEQYKAEGRAAEFTGFPHMPGNDAILSGPAATGNDGGRR
ncbi:MAG: DUF2163 domain-containing protein [Pseudomonadota bacterium]